MVGIPYTDMDKEISVSIVTRWDTRVVADLYRAGGWWKEEWNHDELTSLMRSSFAFAIAHTHESRLSVGMGRVISDGVSDAYIQDLVVIPAWRGKGVGKQILSTLIAYCHQSSDHLDWPDCRTGHDGFLHIDGFFPAQGLYSDEIQ